MPTIFPIHLAKRYHYHQLPRLDATGLPGGVLRWLLGERPTPREQRENSTGQAGGILASCPEFFVS
jgi:hypothetical protein